MATIPRDDNRVPVPGGVCSVREMQGIASPDSTIALVSSAGTGTKNRVFKIIITSDTVTKLSISDTFGDYYCAVGVPIVLDYGSVGKLQTTPATAIVLTADAAANVGTLALYDTE